MTCEYQDINQHDALYNLARRYPGGVEALAARMGTTGKALYAKLRQDPGSAMSFEQATELIELCRGAGVEGWDLPLRAMAWRLAHVAVEIPPVMDPHGASLRVKRLGDHALRVMKESGDVSAELLAALADGQGIDQRELRRIEQQMEEAMAAIATWWADLQAAAEGSQP